MDIIEGGPHLPLTISTLARQCHVSVRTLQEGFQRHPGKSPMAYVWVVRLRRAHRDLRSADPFRSTVSAIAHCWGFTHSAASPLRTKRCTAKHRCKPCALHVARAIIPVADQTPAPTRLALGPDAYDYIHEELTTRIAELESLADVSRPATSTSRCGRWRTATTSVRWFELPPTCRSPTIWAETGSRQPTWPNAREARQVRPRSSSTRRLPGPPRRPGQGVGTTMFLLRVGPLRRATPTGPFGRTDRRNLRRAKACRSPRSGGRTLRRGPGAAAAGCGQGNTRRSGTALSQAFRTHPQLACLKSVECHYSIPREAPSTPPISA
ncbi:AraC-like DNA-binding protein [Mycobacterium sp. AZCC_0083]|nr:AraC-like DNA-binding protein [Mycobacterium sp. AZCC_0083]